MDPDLTSKQLQLLKEATPKISRVAVLDNPTFPATVLGLREAQAAGPALGLAILPMEVRTSDELEAQCAAITSYCPSLSQEFFRFLTNAEVE